jgi:peroxiredoxin
MPSIDEFAATYRGRVNVFTITGDDKKNTREFIEQNGYRALTVLIDEGDKVNKSYNVSGIPTTFVLDKDGKLTLRHLGAQDFTDKEGEIRATIDELLKK